MSIDGAVESPNRWQFDSFDDELGDQMGQLLERVDTAAVGRVGYQEWTGFWPNAEPDDPFGGFINPIEKFVASRTLTGDLKWQNSTPIDGEVEAFLAVLKKTDGGEISLFSSISLVRQLLFCAPLDSLTLMIHPVIVGSGHRLFEPTDPTMRLGLVESMITSTGKSRRRLTTEQPYCSSVSGWRTSSPASTASPYVQSTSEAYIETAGLTAAPRSRWAAACAREVFVSSSL